jgi:hypothetical protein
MNMRRTFNSILLMALALTFVMVPIAQEKNPEVEVRYDKLKDKTRVRLLGMQVEGTLLDGLQMSLLFVIKGERTTKPVSQVTLIMTSTSKDWRYLTGSTSLRAIVDGQMVELGKLPRTRSEVGQGYVIEHLLKKVPGEIVLRLASSKKLEMQLGDLKFAITPQQLAIIRDFAARITGTGN